MKKNGILIVAIVLFTITAGISFAYFVRGTSIVNDGSIISGQTAKLLHIKYDAGEELIKGTNLIPGESIIKDDIKVTITPGSDTTEAIYAITLNISENNFVKCDNSNYKADSNRCEIGAEDLVYTLYDITGGGKEQIGTGDLTGISSGEVKLASITQNVTSEKTFTYQLDITFKNNPDYDQNHNMKKTFAGTIDVVFDDKT